MATMADGTAPFLGKEDIDALKNYVKGSTGQNQAESTVCLHATHSNLSARFFEIRLDMHVSPRLGLLGGRRWAQPAWC